MPPAPEAHALRTDRSDMLENENDEWKRYPMSQVALDDSGRGDTARLFQCDGSG